MSISMNLIQTVGVWLIAAIGACIAYQQKEIAAEKLKLEKFDRRFKVFDATRAFLAHILRSGNVDSEQEREFWIATSDAVFLFDKEVVDFLKDVRLRAIAFPEINRESVQFPQRRRDAFKRFEQDLTTLPNRFAKFLQLKRH